MLECVGTGQAMTTAIDAARPGSTVGFVGAGHGVEVSVRRMFERNVGLAGGMAPVRRYLPELLDLVLEGTIDPGRVFDLTLPLDKVARGLPGDGRATRHQGAVAALSRGAQVVPRITAAPGGFQRAVSDQPTTAQPTPFRM